MNQKRKILPTQQCSMTDEEGKHDPEKMRETRSKSRITYFCPECGYVTWKKIEDEPTEAGNGTRKKGGRPRKRAADPEPEPPKKATEKETKPAPRRGGRGKTKELADGAEIATEGHVHRLHEVTICWPEGPRTFYEIYREDGEWMGRVSQAVSWQRTRDLIARAYHPETERYPAEGITWTGKIRALRASKDSPTVYVTIPRATVERYGILTDDEISVRVGDLRPSSVDGWYHVSEMGRSEKRNKDGTTEEVPKSKIIVLNKLRKEEARRRIESEVPAVGEYATIRIQAHPYKGRHDLCQWAEGSLREAAEKGITVLRPSLTEDMRPKPPEPEKKTQRKNPEPEEASALTVFNDF